MKQIEYLKEAVKLAEEHPDAKIHVCADSDQLLEECGWTGHKINKVELGLWFQSRVDDRIFIDPEEVMEEHENLFEKEITEDEAVKKMEKAILIYTVAG